MILNRANLKFQVERAAINVAAMPIPSVVRAQIHALNDGGNVTGIARIIESDMALIVRVLRSINSAAYGLPRKIVNINEAVALLGYRQLIDICMDAPVMSEKQEQNTTCGFSMLNLWQHSLGTGLAAKLIVEQLQARSDPTAFIAGVLSNFGRYILAVFYWNDYTAALRMSHESDRSLRQAERRVFGVSSEVIGGWAAQALELDDTLCYAIRDRFSKTASSRYSWVIDLASMLADALNMGCSCERVFPLLWRDSLEGNGIDRTVLESIIEMVDSQYREIKSSQAYMAMQESRKGDGN